MPFRQTVFWHLLAEDALYYALFQKSAEFASHNLENQGGKLFHSKQ